ncbi:MAG: diguanylate cyclase [Acidobacteria bacterium]|nr:diguanylate cyclase [Acidobacteriota bacterium]
MEIGPGSRARRWLIETAALAAVYFAAAELGLQLSFVRGNVTPVFPAAGVAVAVLVLRGRGLWPGVFLGALAAHLRTDVPVGVAVAMSCGAPLAAVTAATVLRHPAARFDVRLREVRSTVWFVAAGVALPAIVSATWGVSSLVVGNVVPNGEFATSWWVWCVGDALGAVVAGSLILVWSQTERGWHDPRASEAIVLTVGSVGAAAALFFFASDGEVLLLPLLVLIAARLDSRWTTAVVFAVAMLAAGATSASRGPFAVDNVHTSLVHLSLFLAAGTLTSLVLGAAVAERDLAHRRLGRVNDELERRVADRTRDLAASEANLTAVVEHITDAVAIVDGEGTVHFANPTAELWLGLRAGEPFLKALGQRVEDQAPAFYAFERWLSEPGLGPLAHFVVTLPDGTDRHLEAVGENLVADPLLRGIIVTARDVTGHELRARNLWQQARHDALTGLPNRRHFVEELGLALERRQLVGVLFADLDGLKQVNDTFGHGGGDRLLKAVGERLQAALRSGDFAARLAGDEFTILLYGVNGPADAMAAGNRLLGVISDPFEIGETPLSITASVGIALASAGSPDALIQAADAAMYRAKRAGGGHVIVHDLRSPPEGDEHLLVEA